MTNQFIGTGVALVTPFKSNLEVDFEALTRIVKYVSDNGVNYLVVLGTTGEPATLSSTEKKQVIDCIKSANTKNLPLVLGVGGNNTTALIEELQTADFTGFSAILSVSPYYNKPSQEGIYQHFAALAKVSPLPIILYNVPGRTASNMLPKTVARLANDFSNIIGIKEAAGDVVQAMELIRLVPKDFLVISGDDMVTLPIILAGGAGVISVIGEGIPAAFSKMVQLGLERKVDEAFALHYQIAPAIDLIFEEGNPAGIKEMQAQLGLCENAVRLPLVAATDSLKAKIAAYLKSAH